MEFNMQAIGIIHTSFTDPAQVPIQASRSQAAGQVLVTALVANGEGNQRAIAATPLWEAPPDLLAEAIGVARSLPGRLAPRFRALPEADLAVAGLVLVARKPI